MSRSEPLRRHKFRLLLSARFFSGAAPCSLPRLACVPQRARCAMRFGSGTVCAVLRSQRHISPLLATEQLPLPCLTWRLGFSSPFSDTVSKVIRGRRRRAVRKLASPEAVNNFAVAEMNSSEKLLRPGHHSSGRIAPDGSRSSVFHPARIKRSLSARPAAPEPNV